jgi:hypothetical protein
LMTRSTPTPPSPIEGEGVRRPYAANLPSPLAGEGQGGGVATFHARTEARSWPLRSPVRCVKISPTPSGGSGLGCADGSSTVAASGDRLLWVLTSSTSCVSRRGWSSRLMEASTARGPSKMLSEALGSRPTDSTSCAFGTTRCPATWKGCWRRSGGPCRTERRIDPPPRPSATRGEGRLFCASRLIKRRACVISAPNRDEADRSGLVPQEAPAGGGETAALLERNSLPPCGGGLGRGVYRA